MIRQFVTRRLPIIFANRVYVGNASVVRSLERSNISLRRQALTESFCRETGRIIQGGLFQGTVLPPPIAWGLEDYSAMLLGTYEQELHEHLQSFIDSNPDALINLGCASGLYAAGIARQLPLCSVVANDISAEAIRATSESWELNGLVDSNPLELAHGPATFDQLESWLRPYQRPLLIVDVEGYERELLDPLTVPSLTKAIIVCELHDQLAPATTELISRRLSATHSLVFVRSGARNPHELSLLREYDEHDRWLAVSEDRSGGGQWVCAVPQ